MTDVIVLAAGLGTRLLPHTADRPKVMVDVGGQCLLDTLIERLDSDARISSTTVVTGYFGETLSRHISSKHLVKTSSILNQRFAELGPAYSVLCGIRHYSECDDVAIVNGDTFFTPGAVEEIVDVIASRTNENLLFGSRCGEFCSDDIKIISVDGRLERVGKGVDEKLATMRSAGFFRLASDCAVQKFQFLLERSFRNTTSVVSAWHNVVDEFARTCASVDVHHLAPSGWHEVDNNDDLEALTKIVVRQDASKKVNHGVG